MRRFRLQALVVVLAAGIPLSLICSPTTAVAQSASGVGDDAIPVPAHGTRIHIVGLWTEYDSRFAPTAHGGNKRSALFSGYARENLGVKDIPALGAAETSIRDLSGLGSAFSLSLGKLEARGDITRSIVPLQLEYGVTRRLSVGVLVPYVETRSNNKFVLNRGGAGATVGENPARLSTSAARVTNGTVISQIAASRAALNAEITRCNDVAATGGGCIAIRANPAAALSVLTQSAAITQQISALYGTATAAGAPLVPISKSAAQKAIETRLGALRTSFEQFASNNMDAATLPVGATLVYGSAGLQALVKDPAYGLAYDTLANGGRAGIGDVDVVATFLLFDAFGANQVKRLLEPRRALRSSVSAGWRFGTATGGRSDSPFDAPTGEGANALLLRSTTDLIVNRRFWISGTARYTKPLEDNVVTRLPGLTDSTLFTPFVQVAARRNIGARTEIEIAPRYALGTFFGVSMAYAIGHQQASTINALKNADLAESSYESPATTVQAMQFGATFSTLGSFARGKSRWPLEVIYSHGVTVSGSGGFVPAQTSDRVELRIYTRFPRR